jgi:hypothetical protein
MILGAIKGGTTSLYFYLSQHPDVLFSTPKEPVFFEYEYARGLEYYQRTYFSALRQERAIGEARGLNLFLPFVPDRILATLPEVRFIVILRDPVERAFSHWWMRRCQGLESLSFTDAVAENLERLAAGQGFEGEEGARQWLAGFDPVALLSRARIYVDAGYYAQQLQNYYARFPRERIKVVFFEDLQGDPEALVRELWSFLGVDSDVPLTGLLPYNPAVPSQLSGLFRFAYQHGLTRLIPPGIGLRLRHWVSRIGSPPRIEPGIELWLRQHYASHNRALEQLLSCDLSHWAPRQV